MKITLYTLLVLLCCNGAFAQYAQNPKSFADQAFKNKNYYEAAYYYKQAAEGMNLAPKDIRIPFQEALTKKAAGPKSSDVNYVTYQLADSYRLYENYLEAEGWYYKIINANAEAEYPLARLWYGVCLRANQHFDEAIQQLMRFADTYHGDSKNLDMAKNEIANCRFAQEQYQYPGLIDVAKLKGDWNSDGSNYAMLQRNSNFMFTSSRLNKDDKKHLNRLYNIASTGTNLTEIKLKGDDKKDAEYGTPALDPTGSKLYFTRWYKSGSKTLHAIYRSDLKNGIWGPMIKLNSNVNLDAFNAIQPFVTADGKQLYFVSDKPGGQGGNDIWVSDLDADGNPVNSVNLGNTINTPLDEQAPYYDKKNNRLVFSSKGLTGLGGFDLFTSTGNMGYWGKPENMGYPLNSAKDDLYYSVDANNPEKFYISSDRQSDCCLEVFEAYDKRFTLKGLVTDCDTHKPLAGAKVSFVDSISKKVIKEVTLGRDAQYVFDVTTNRPYNLVLEKTGYFTKVVPVPQPGNKLRNDTLYNADLCLQAFVVNKPIVINNILYDFNKADLRPESKVILNDLVHILKDNPKIKIELAAHTDSIGSDAYNNNLSQMRAQSCVDYIISNGIEADRIFAKGYGKTRPIAPNSKPDGSDNPEGRQLNRRTEFTVLKTE
jgi:outer membrane protein OmpA-like peptidoglycan-associated protein